MTGVATVVVIMVAAVVMVWRLMLVERRGAGIDANVDALRHQVGAWQSAHDHQVEVLDRRMRDVEVAAARAEREARMLSVQLVGNDGIVPRIERLEAWVSHLAQGQGAR
jgi:hypothetical protein